MIGKRGWVAAGAMVLFASQAAFAGKIVLSNDEWQLSETGFAFTPSNAATFATNVASYFSGGGPGTFHAYSTNFGLTGPTLSATLSGAGHAYSTGTGITWDLPTLLGYDGILLAGTTVPDLSVLTAYVNAGGNVFLAGGTGSFPSAAAEAAYWNAFLSSFGLAFGSPYNGVGGVVPIASAHPVFAGVTGLYQDNGNDTLDIDLLDPAGVVLVTSASGHGLYAVYDSNAAAVPLPRGAWMGLSVLGGLGGLGLLRRSRRRRAAMI